MAKRIKDANSLMRDIKRKTRRKFSSEEKIYADLPFVKRHHGNLEKVSERVAVILGQLFHRMIFNKDLDPTEGYISLNAQILESLVEDYHPILDWAIESKIIESDGQYIAGEKSTGYRFHSDYWRKTGNTTSTMPP